jgi:phosphatidate cytidylyltransferase
MHRTRVMTSIIGLALLILILVYVQNLLIFWVVVSAAIVIGLLEFYQMVEARGLPVYKLPGVLLGWLLSLAPLIGASFQRATLTEFTLSLIILALLLYALLTKRPLLGLISAIAITLFGILYVSWLLSHLVWLRGLANGNALIGYLLLVVWSGDTGAYYVGRLLGKHPLAPTVSPKKTIEGAIGGFVASLLASCIAKWTFFPLLRYKDCILLGILLAVISQLGDLCESLLKRSADVKDSGTILPGHGGILDRVDGVMFAAPVLYYYAILFLIA